MPNHITDEMPNELSFEVKKVNINTICREWSQVCKIYNLYVDKYLCILLGYRLGKNQENTHQIINNEYLLVGVGVLAED